MKDITVNVLGTPYQVLFRGRKEDPKLDEADGYCDTSTKTIVVHSEESRTEQMLEVEMIPLDNATVRTNHILRHELVHAFIYESGLSVEVHWAYNEMLIDWIAMQLPKLWAASEKAKELIWKV